MIAEFDSGQSVINRKNYLDHFTTGFVADVYTFVI